MNPTRWTATAAVVLAAITTLMSMPAAAATSIHVDIGPPALRHEAMPALRPGHVWVPGHWRWQGNRHAWVQGHYLRARHGQHYQQAQWQQQGDRWVYRTGGWGQGDADRDGVSNRHDHDRDNDGVRNRHDRDRDGDGVRNRRDRRADNPRRN